MFIKIFNQIKILTLLILFLINSQGKELNELKVLHLSFHTGCIKDFEYVAHKLGLNLTSLNVPGLPRNEWDELSPGSTIYSMGHDRAARIWNKKKDFFNQFDIIVTSDIAPLSRIFLQNGWNKPLIVWVCNRFDYCDMATNDCRFPDDEYFSLVQQSLSNPKVKWIPYTAFETLYARNSRNIIFKEEVITPIGAVSGPEYTSKVPGNIDKKNSFFVPDYVSNTEYVKTEQQCRNIGINAYCGRYAGPKELKDFKAVIHMPYQWSNLAFFENIKEGIIHFIPTLDFIRRLNSSRNGYYHADANFFFSNNISLLSEWYNEEHKDIVIKFDSWQDLKYKTENINYEPMRDKIKTFAQEHEQKTLQKWQNAFNELSKFCN